MHLFNVLHSSPGPQRRGSPHTQRNSLFNTGTYEAKASPQPHRHSLQLSNPQRPGKYSPEELEYRLTAVKHGMSPANSDPSIRASLRDIRASSSSPSSPFATLMTPSGPIEPRDRSGSLSSRTEPATEAECEQSLKCELDGHALNSAAPRT